MKPQEDAASGAKPEEQIPLRTTTTRQYRDTQVDVKLVLCALWIAMMFVFASGDIFGFFRSDVLKAALDGKVATTGFEVNQVSLTFTLIYIRPAVLMVVLSLLLTPQLHRSDPPRRHRTNSLEMAATSDRTLAAISSQLAEPAS